MPRRNCWFLASKFLTVTFVIELFLLFTKPIIQKRDFAQVFAMMTGPPFSTRTVQVCFLTMAIAAAIVIVDVTTPPPSHTAWMGHLCSVSNFLPVIMVILISWKAALSLRCCPSHRFLAFEQLLPGTLSTTPKHCFLSKQYPASLKIGVWLIRYHALKLTGQSSSVAHLRLWHTVRGLDGDVISFLNSSLGALMTGGLTTVNKALLRMAAHPQTWSRDEATLASYIDTSTSVKKRCGNKFLRE